MSLATSTTPKHIATRNGRPYEMVRGDLEVEKIPFGVIKHKGNYCCDYGWSNKDFDECNDVKIIDGNTYAFFYDKWNYNLAVDLHTFTPENKKRYFRNEFSCYFGNNIPEHLRVHRYTKKNTWVIKYLD
jgi:hypothetical protein